MTPSLNTHDQDTEEAVACGPAAQSGPAVTPRRREGRSLPRP